jgi:hypothetical protein
MRRRPPRMHAAAVPFSSCRRRWPGRGASRLPSWPPVCAGCLLTVGVLGCGSSTPTRTGQLAAFSRTVTSTDPSLPAPPVVVTVAPDPRTHRLTYAAANKGTAVVDVTFQFTARDSGFGLASDQGMCEDTRQVCTLGSVAPGDAAHVIVQEPLEQGVATTPEVLVLVHGVDGDRAAASARLPASSMDWSKAAAIAPAPGVAPLAALAETTSCLVVSSGRLVHNVETLRVVNPARVPLDASLGLDGYERGGVRHDLGEIAVVGGGGARPSQGKVRPGSARDRQGERTARLIWQVGTIPAGGSATLTLVLSRQLSTATLLRLIGWYETRPQTGRAVHGVWEEPVPVSPATPSPTMTRSPSATATRKVTSSHSVSTWTTSAGTTWTVTTATSTTRSSTTTSSASTSTVSAVSTPSSRAGSATPSPCAASGAACR